MAKTTRKTSQTGTKCMEIKPSDLTKLLVAAGEAGVSELVFQGLEVKFYEKSPIVGTVVDSPEALLSAGGELALQPPVDFDPNQGTLPLQEVVTSPEDRARLRELEHEQLMLDDPIAFEALNIDLLMGNDIHA